MRQELRKSRYEQSLVILGVVVHMRFCFCLLFYCCIPLSILHLYTRDSIALRKTERMHPEDHVRNLLNISNAHWHADKFPLFWFKHVINVLCVSAHGPNSADCAG